MVWVFGDREVCGAMLVELIGVNGCVCFQNYLIGAFGPPCSISIDFADAETRKQASVKKENAAKLGTDSPRTNLKRPQETAIQLHGS